MTNHDWTSNVRVYLAYITPDVAGLLLDKNDHNRRENSRTIAAFSKSLKEGRVYLSDSAITTAPDNTLTNGQNRLRACVETGIPFWAIRAEGVPFEAQLIMDTGGKRTFAQHLEIAYGERNSSAKAATTVALWNLENGAYGYRGNFFNRPTPRIVDLDGLWREAGSEIVEAVADIDAVRRRTRYSKTPLALVRLVTKRIDAEDSNFFFDRLASGVDLAEGSPILAARKWIETASRNGTRVRPDAEQQAAILLKAWNKFRAGEPATILIFRPGGANPERYPVAS